MTPAKLNVLFCFYPYGGNGGASSEHPNIRNWFAKTIAYCKTDNRIGETFTIDYSDTPIPMLRNRSVLDARQHGADVLVMVDSDQHPDLYVGLEPDAKPFFESTFDFLYKRKLKGQTTCVGAPYCGPPPGECVYVFKWTNSESNHPNIDQKIEMYSREEGAQMTGIHPCAALPTGCIMFDMDLFEVTDPKHEYAALLKKHGSKQIAMALTRPWFYYEYDDIYQAKKASTEDVTATRDMLLCAYARLGYNVLFANWDSWAGHWKPKCVGKPVLLPSDTVHAKYAEAILSGRKVGHGFLNLEEINATAKTISVTAVPGPPKQPIIDTIEE